MNPRIHIPLLLLLLLAGCGLTVTGEYPAYEELNKEEQSAVDLILAELKALDKQTRARTKAIFGQETGLDPVVDLDRIHVSFHGRLLAMNIGDGVLHISTWENLDASQQAKIQAAFNTTAAKAKRWYEKFFYRVMAVSNGLKQYIFNIGSPGKAFGSFSLFNMEMHPMRTAMGYFKQVGRSNDIFTFMTAACKQVLAQGSKAWGALWTAAESRSWPRFPRAKEYMRDNAELFLGAGDPTATLYFLCQFADVGMDENEGFDLELKWLHSKLK